MTKNIIKEYLADELHKVFISLNVNQREFSDMLGTSKVSVSRIFSKKFNAVSIETLIDHLIHFGKKIKIDVTDIKG